MSVAELKEALHHAIEKIQDEKQLEEILTEVRLRQQAHALTKDEIRILEERNAKYMSGESKPVPLEEVQAQMRKKYGF